MKPQTIIPHLLFFIFLTIAARAQCPTGDVTLLSQAEVNAFATNYPSCTTLPGHLGISGNNIMDLSPLENLETIGGYLLIYNNSSLKNVDGLSSLSSIGRYLLIHNNSTLANLDGLSSLSSLGEDMLIYNNSSLKNVDGLSSLSSIGGYLWIDNNSTLANLDGLSSLSSLGRYLWIANNSTLANVDGLSSLSSLGEDLWIDNNSSLTNVNGLSSLSSIGGFLAIQNNAILPSLEGLENIDPGSITELWIQNNPLLSYCDLSNICTYLAGTGPRTISNNSGECATAADIKVACQENCPDDVTLSSQAQVEEYGEMYGYCAEISGNLTINGSDITDLSPLENLETIGDNLMIWNNGALENLDGLSSLNSIGGSLSVKSNSSLTNVDGLSSLNSIGGGLSIYNNGSLASVDGLSFLTSIGGYLYVGSNSSLTNVDGLSSLTSIGGYLEIRDNSSLTNVDGLSSLTSIGASLYIFYNSSLTNVDGLSSLLSIGRKLYIISNVSLTNVGGLSSLASIGGDLAIYNNGALVNMDGLSSLNSIGGYLEIRDNSSLTNVDGFSSLTSVGGVLWIQNNAILPSLEGLENIDPGLITDLIIQNNPLLSYCDLSNICTYIEGTGPRTISNNVGECATAADVANACLPEVVSVSNPADFTVSCPVLYDDLDLPETVTVTYDDGTTEDVVVNWDGTGFASFVGTYTLTGELQLMNMTTNPNLLTAQIDILVEDITAPVMSCPESYEVDCDRVVTFDLPQATDECSAVSAIQTDGTRLSSGSVFPIGTTTLTFRAVDDSGNASHCSVEVKILPPLEIQAVSDVARGDTIHLTDCLPPDISRDDLDISPHRGRISFRSNIYPADLPEPRPHGMWKLLEYTYEVTDRCGVTKSFENYVALYDLDPPVFRNFPPDISIDSPDRLPPAPSDVRILDICRYVVWDTVTTTPIVDPETSDTLAFVRRWTAEDGVGNKSFRDQMIYIHSVPRPDLNRIKAHIVKESDLPAARFPGGVGTDSIPVTLYRIDSVTGSNPVDTRLSGNWQGSKGTVVFSPLLPGSYRINIDVPPGYEAFHPDSLIMADGWSDTLVLSGDSTLDLETILLVPVRDTTAMAGSLVEPGIPDYSEISAAEIKPVSIYPNPTSGRIKIEVQKGISLNYTIFNHLGRVMENGRVENGSVLDLSKQAHGMYFIRLENQGFVATKKILLFNQ